MAEFSGKIDTAYYVNEEHTLIEVVYTNEEDMQINYMIEAEDNADYRALVSEGYDEETLLDRTSEYKRVHARAIGELINTQAQYLAEEMMGMRFLINQKKHLEDQKKHLEDQKDILNKESTDLSEKAENQKKTLASLDQDVKIKTNKIDHALYDFFRDNNENKEELFKFKLWALEQDVVKKADKSVKSSIRKATRITSVMAIYDSLI